MAGNSYRGTVVGPNDFDKEHDAVILRKAMKGLGTEERAVIDIITKRTNIQRQEIKHYYKACYGRELSEDFKSELSGNFRDVIVGLMDTPAVYDARCLWKAMKGLGTDEKALVEILCTRNNNEIEAIKEAYQTGRFDDIGRLLVRTHTVWIVLGTIMTLELKRNLEKDIVGDTSGHFKRLLLAMCAAGREENSEADEEKAKKDACVMYNAGEKFWGTNEAEIQRILSIRSYTQLRATFAEYDKISKLGIENAIISETSGDLKDGYLAIVKCVKNPSAFFAERIHHAIKGLGTNNDMLIRCIVSRAEVDMVMIKEEYHALYGKTLLDAIKSDTSGQYKNALVSLIGERS